MHIKYMSKDNMATKFLTKGFQKGIQDIRIIAIGCSNSWFKKSESHKWSIFALKEITH